MKKRVAITVQAEEWEKLQALGKFLGYKKDWLSKEIQHLVAALIVVADQAKQDAVERSQMTEEEARVRYEQLARSVIEKRRI